MTKSVEINKYLWFPSSLCQPWLELDDSETWREEELVDSDGEDDCIRRSLNH